MATPTLTEFLLARIAEDEAMALAAKGDSPTPWANDGGTLKDAANTSLAGYCGEETAEYIVRHDPDRVLARCEADRRIVIWLQAALDIKATDDKWRGDQHLNALGLAVQALATVYADHPDYDEAWSLA